MSQCLFLLAVICVRWTLNANHDVWGDIAICGSYIFPKFSRLMHVANTQVAKPWVIGILITFELHTGMRQECEKQNIHLLREMDVSC